MFVSRLVRTAAVAVVLLTVVSPASPVAAQPTVTPNSPYRVGPNAIVVQGGGPPLAVAEQIESASGLRVEVLWMLSGGMWTFYLPVTSPLSTLTTFPAVATAFAILSRPEFSLVEVNRLDSPVLAQRRMVEVQFGQQADYGNVVTDRVVWVFSGALPPYRVAYAPMPVSQCASGMPVPLAGGAALEVRFDRVLLFDDSGSPLLPAGEFTPNYPALLESKRICAFEGQATWALGIRSPRPFRVIEMSDPPRLVIDILWPNEGSAPTSASKSFSPW